MSSTDTHPELGTAISYAVEYRNGRREIRGDGVPAFTLFVTDESQLDWVLTGSEYAVALAFIHGEFDVQGDLIEAFKLKSAYTRPSFTERLETAAARLAPVHLENWLQSRERAAANIHFHYDKSTAFFEKFLDKKLVYSAGYFKDPNWSLDQAQEAKLEGICRDLDLRPGDRFLDVGCGWGALLTHAAQRYNVSAAGCTLSHNQYEFTKSRIAALGLGDRASVREMDYRDLSERFTKVASIGMFEHVGRRRLGVYFQKIYSLLEDGGLFLNSGITRPQPVHDDPETRFLAERVFPGGELPHLSDLVREAESAGFSVLEIESQRQDYARTCRAWVERLRKNVNSCLSIVGMEIYRTWLLYLSASALNFELGQTDVFRMLMTKDGFCRSIPS